MRFPKKPVEAFFPENEAHSGLDFSILLIGSENSGNIGAVCRVMKNFGFHKLILFNNLAHVTSESYGFAMHASDVLDNAEIITAPTDPLKTLDQIFERFDVIIGTSAKGYSHKNVNRIPVFIDELDLNFPVASNQDKTRILIVFGRESVGLTNEEIRRCDFLVQIPANPEYPTLNLSHAVGVILFSLFKKIRKIERRRIIPASYKHRQIFLGKVDKAVGLIEKDVNRQEEMKIVFRNIFGRAFTSRKEVSSLMRLFDSINYYADKWKDYENQENDE